MTVYLVGAGPGDPGLLTRRGAELLAAADVVVHDRLVDPGVLALARPGAELVDVGKVPAPHPTATTSDTRQHDIHELLVLHGRAGRTVVRLKGGDPFVFGRGGEEAEALAAAGVPFEVVPGVTSATAVPAAAGVPVTHRGLSTSVTVVTGHVGDPTAPGGVDWASLGRAGGTLVVLMGMATREEIARRLIDAGRPSDTPVAVVEWGATPRQRTERTTLAGLPGVSLGSPAVVVIGPVAALDLSGTALPLSGATVVVTRARHQAGPLAAALSGAGARVVELPVIDVTGPEDGGAGLRRSAAGVAGYRWVAFTSANAVRRFLPLLRDARSLAGVGVAVVGEATARALADHGLVPDLVAEPSTAEGLVSAFPDPPRWTGSAVGARGARPSGATGSPPDPVEPGARVLFPRAAEGRETLPVGLRARGWEVDEVIAYRTVIVEPPLDAVADDVARADAITFTSPSTVRSYLSLRTRGGRSLPVPPVVACIGPVTAAAARTAGLEVAVEAGTPSVEGLVGALVAVRSPRGPSTGPAGASSSGRAPSGSATAPA